MQLRFQPISVKFAVIVTSDPPHKKVYLNEIGQLMTQRRMFLNIFLNYVQPICSKFTGFVVHWFERNYPVNGGVANVGNLTPLYPLYLSSRSVGVTSKQCFRYTHGFPTHNTNLIVTLTACEINVLKLVFFDAPCSAVIQKTRRSELSQWQILHHG